MKCLTCGYHPLNYIHCDRWDCPRLVAKWTKSEQFFGAMPAGSELVEEEERDMGGWPFNRMPEDEDARERDPPDEETEEEEEEE